jgi:hypothetical protein
MAPALTGRSGFGFWFRLRFAFDAFRKLLSAGLTVPFLVGLRRDFSLHEELRKLPALRLTLERHRAHCNGSTSLPWKSTFAALFRRSGSAASVDNLRMRGCSRWVYQPKLAHNAGERRLVRKRGFEPRPDCSDQLLRLARLPFRHFRKWACSRVYGNPFAPTTDHTASRRSARSAPAESRHSDLLPQQKPGTW